MLTPFTAESLTATAAVAVTAATLLNGAMRPESQIFGRTIVAGSDPLEAAFTYDDGPNDASTYALLDVLAQHNVRATFFMIGKHVRQRPGIVRTVHAAGHLIGNHTMTHPWLAWQTAHTIHEELRTCNEALEDTLGAPVRYFRPPHGARRPFVIREARNLGMKVVQWNVMGYDWLPIEADKVIANVDGGLARAKRYRRGANILLHDGGDVSMSADRHATVAATDRLLTRFIAEGRRTVTVDHWG